MNGAQITVWEAGNQASNQKSNPDGSFSVNGLAAGDYLFKVEHDGYLPVYGAVSLTDGSHRIGVVMRESAGAGNISAEAAGPLRTAHRPLRDAAKPPVVKPAQVKSKRSPLYPPSERQAGVSGTVRIAMIILPNGTVDDLVVLSAPDGVLAEAALAAVRQWRYSPTYLDGQAVEASLTVDVNFK